MDEHMALTPGLLSRSQAHHIEELSDEAFWRYASEIAAAPSPTQEEKENYLLCYLGPRNCILSPDFVREIVAPPHQLTLLPSSPSWMPGLTVWRGEVIALADLRAYLWNEASSVKGMPSTISSPDLLLVLQSGNLALGLLVTAIATLQEYNEEYMVPSELAPDWFSELRPGTLRGVFDDALVLDVPFIFDNIIQQIKEFSSYE